MLVLARRHGEEIVIKTSDGLIVLTVTAIEGGKVKLGFNAPPDVVVHRREVWDQVQHEQEQRKRNGERKWRLTKKRTKTLFGNSETFSSNITATSSTLE